MVGPVVGRGRKMGQEGGRRKEEGGRRNEKGEGTAVPIETTKHRPAIFPADG
jgi:hypothetical protein